MGVVKDLRFESRADTDELREAVKKAREIKPHIAHSYLAVTIGQSLKKRYTPPKVKQD